jgi:hypothetical protein
MEREREVDLNTGIARTNTAGAAWLALPSELHISNGVLMSTRAEPGLEVAGISSVWLGISSVSYHLSPDNQSCFVLYLLYHFPYCLVELLSPWHPLSLLSPVLRLSVLSMQCLSPFRT